MKAGDVTARARQAGNETLPGWIADDGEDDWDRAGHLFQGRKSRGGAGDNHIRCRTNQFARVCLRLGGIGLGKSASPWILRLERMFCALSR